MAMEAGAVTPKPGRRGPSSGHPVLRVAVVWLFTGAVFVLLGWLLPGLTVTSAGAALAAAGLLGLINALVWPVFAFLALPLAVLTLGIAAIVLNGAAVAIVAYLLPGIDVRDLGTAIVVALVLALANTMLTSLLTLDDEDVYYRRIIRRAARRVRPEGASDVPGVLFIQIDGLGMTVLRRALRDGNAPTLARWLASGSHRLLGWETGWSSQTGASQCGILHGSTFDIPAFRWLEKETGTRIVSNHPRSAAEIERRHSDGHGLLHADGVGRGNLYTGDAAQNILTMSVAGPQARQGGPGLLRILRGPLQHPAHAGRVRRRSRPGTRPGLPAAAPRRPPAGAPWRPVPVPAGLCHGDHPGPDYPDAHRRPVHRPFGHLRRFRRLRRGRAPFRARTLRRSRHPSPSRPGSRAAGARRRERAAPLPVRGAVRPRPEPGNHLRRPVRVQPRRTGPERDTGRDGDRDRIRAGGGGGVLGICGRRGSRRHIRGQPGRQSAAARPAPPDRRETGPRRSPRSQRAPRWEKRSCSPRETSAWST